MAIVLPKEFQIDCVLESCQEREIGLGVSTKLSSFNSNISSMALVPPQSIFSASDVKQSHALPPRR
jgi:hypothetical protein